jgi:hypothetical protein
MMLQRGAPSAAALRKRRLRDRQRRGAIVLRVEVDEAELALAMLRAGRLGESEALCRGELERAASEVLSDWSRRWK